MNRWTVYTVFLLGILAFAARAQQQEEEEGQSCQSSVIEEEGTCIPILECPIIRDLLVHITAGFASDDVRERFTRSLCTNKKLVCCPRSKMIDNTSNKTRASITTNVQQGVSLLPKSCGTMEFLDRIIEGEDAELLAWPWKTLLRGRSNGRKSWFCGGSIISERYVLTAAHCFSKEHQVELDFVRVGEHNLSQDPDCEKGICAPSPIDVAVEKIILHPSYGSPCKECNDIALLRLSSALNINSFYVRPICLPLNPEDDIGFLVQELEGKKAWAIGWGTTNPDPANPRFPDVLQQALLLIRDNPFCKFLRNNYTDPSAIICAGGNGQDTCNGDSGGPLFLPNENSSKYFQIGITSVGPRRCATRHTVGLYTNVHHYIPWILSNLEP